MVAHRQAHDPHLASPQTRRRLRLRCCGRAAVIDGAEPAAQRRPAEGARPLGHGELCLTTTVSAPAPRSCPRALYARCCQSAQRCPAPVASAVARARRSRAERQKPGGRCRPGASRSTSCTAPGDTTENRRWRKPDLALPPRRLARLRRCATSSLTVSRQPTTSSSRWRRACEARMMVFRVRASGPLQPWPRAARHVLSLHVRYRTPTPLSRSVG